MSAKTSADVLIGGKIYTLSGYESEAYLQKVANYINNKINEFEEMEQFRHFQPDMKSTLLELNIADDYFKAKEQAERLEQDIEQKDKEIYELKHDLISSQIKLESSEKSITELEKENRELLLHKAKLETALEDALLGKVKGQVMPEEMKHDNGVGESSTSEGDTGIEDTGIEDSRNDIDKPDAGSSLDESYTGNKGKNNRTNNYNNSNKHNNNNNKHNNNGNHSSNNRNYSNSNHSNYNADTRDSMNNKNTKEE